MDVDRFMLLNTIKINKLPRHNENVEHCFLSRIGQILLLKHVKLENFISEG